MPPRLYEVYVEPIRFREAEKKRPWIVVAEPSAGPMGSTEIVVAILPLSTAFDLMNDQKDFPIYSTDPDFAESGLRVSSYCIDMSPVWVPSSLLRNKIGELKRDLLADFKRWAGDS